jgi:uncharacterized membrane protein YdjX (TVP38/TMEM64 family)
LKPAWGKIIAAAVILAILAAVWRLTPVADALTQENLTAWTRTMRGYWWAPLAVLLAYAVGSCVLFPRPLLTLVTVVTFGVWPGLAYGVAGVLASALAGYGAGRLLPGSTVRRIAGDKLEAAAEKVKDHGVIAVFAANMTPVPPFVVQNIIAGAIRIRLWQFLFGTLLSVLPGAAAWALFGHELNALLDEEDNASYWLMGAGVALFVAFMFFTRRWLRKQEADRRPTGAPQPHSAR